MARTQLGGLLRKEGQILSSATREALRFLGRAHGHRHPRRPAGGATPDAMVIAADAPKPQISWTRYSATSVETRDVTEVSTLRAAIGTETTDWIRVQGFGDEEQLRALAEAFGVHPLALADVVNVPQRAKIDRYEGHTLIVLRSAHTVEGRIEIQQLSLVMGPSWVITFEERASGVFEPVDRRLRSEASALRGAGADFLAYALIDAAVDGFFPVLDSLSDVLENLEEAAIVDPEPHTLARIHAVRRLLIHLERTQRHQRDALLSLSHEDGVFGDAVRPYLRDVQDHSIHVLDTVETLREITVGIMDIYLSSVSNRTNEVMKTLTIMASLFIPLSFIAGVYGMNFDRMPELHWRFGYAGAWAVMLLVAAGMIAWFGWRGWLWGQSGRRDQDDTDEGPD